MIPPGTERVRPEKQRRPRRPKQERKPAATPPAADGAPTPSEKVMRPQQQRRPPKPRRERREPQRQPRTGSYEKRAAKKLVPITKAMEEGKEFMRSFGDLLQYHQKKKLQSQPGADAPLKQELPPASGNGASESAPGSAGGLNHGSSQAANQE
jgi:hypothetical protein